MNSFVFSFRLFLNNSGRGRGGATHKVHALLTSERMHRGRGCRMPPHRDVRTGHFMYEEQRRRRRQNDQSCGCCCRIYCMPPAAPPPPHTHTQPERMERCIMLIESTNKHLLLMTIEYITVPISSLCFQYFVSIVANTRHNDM